MKFIFFYNMYLYVHKYNKNDQYKKNSKAATIQLIIAMISLR